MLIVGSIIQVTSTAVSTVREESYDTVATNNPTPLTSCRTIINSANNDLSIAIIVVLCFIMLVLVLVILVLSVCLYYKSRRLTRLVIVKYMCITSYHRSTRAMQQKATLSMLNPSTDHLEMMQNDAYTIISGQGKGFEKGAKEFAMYEMVDLTSPP